MDIEKEVTKEIINQADQDAVLVIVHDFNEEDNAIFCSLIDADGNTITDSRIFSFEKFPCEYLTQEEKDTIKNIIEPLK